MTTLITNTNFINEGPLEDWSPVHKDKIGF